MAIGAKLRMIRRQWQLSLREVEERSRRIAEERGNLSYKVSASWLDRLEREAHELTVNKLIGLAEVYSLPAEQLLCSICPGDPQPVLKQRSTPHATMLLTECLPEEQVTLQLPNTPNLSQLTDETMLLSPESGLLAAPYRRGIIGKRDPTMAPMIPAGSIVQIDTQRRAILSQRDWAHEFQRPIYFFMTREGYVCGWCELDKASDWLTLVPHPLSPASNRRWKYRTEIQTIGRVASVALRLAE
jgi:transcriptional regulator with XRE-family HTH domain